MAARSRTVRGSCSKSSVRSVSARGRDFHLQMKISATENNNAMSLTEPPGNRLVTRCRSANGSRQRASTPSMCRAAVRSRIHATPPGICPSRTSSVFTTT